MITYLKGIVIKKTDKGLIVVNQGIGYFMHSTKNILAELKENDESEFFTHQHIREDSSDLYGFSQYADLEFFKTLISISGIGPKVGLEILNMPSSKIKNAIINEDSAYISTVPGIGQKTSKRIILELKGKITVDELERGHQNITTSASDDILDALIKLGFQRNHILKTLKTIPEDIKEEQAIITYFLKHN